MTEHVSISDLIHEPSGEAASATESSKENGISLMGNTVTNEQPWFGAHVDVNGNVSTREPPDTFTQA